MNWTRFSGLLVLVVTGFGGTVSRADESRLERIAYNNPGLVVDLGVGLWAWPLPMDYDRDGDLDLVVSCPDVPYRGSYFFENPGSPGLAATEGSANDGTLPVFKPAVRIADRMPNVQVSYVGGEPVVTAPGKVFLDFRTNQFENVIELPVPVKIDPQYERYRANQWKLVDWEGDGDLDLVIGIGVWDDYGWDDAWDEEGNWVNGPLHGFVYFVENVAAGRGASAGAEMRELAEDQPWPEYLGPRPMFVEPFKLEAGGEPVDVYGMPSPNLADFDGDGDLDLICGEFLDGFIYFENAGTRAESRFLTGRRLRCSFADGTMPLEMDLQMITPVALDWNGDGAIDIICGDEDGRVALIANAGYKSQGSPLFEFRRYLRQEADEVKFGALVTPFSVDWDGDGDEDLICGNTAGYVCQIENLGEWPVSWNRPSSLYADKPHNRIHLQAGPQGSIQGPCEAKWGYSTVNVADWNHNNRLDVIVNGIWGKVRWYSNLGQFSEEQNLFGETVRTRFLEAAQPVSVQWNGSPPKPSWTWWEPETGELATQWRTTPCVLDWNNDNLNDLVMLDHEGYLAFYERANRGEELVLLPPERIFKIEGSCEFDSRHRPVGDKQDGLLRLNANRAGASGRRKLHFVDWDGDGRLDLLVNSVNVNFLRNVRTDEEGFTWFRDEGPLDERVLAGHTTSPTTVDWDGNGIPDLLVGAEDGFLYYKENPRAALAADDAVERDDDSRAVAGSDEDEGVLMREFIYEDAPFPECHASTIAETPQGLVAAWFGGTHERNEDVGIWVARRVEGGWTEPVEVANGIQHAGLRHPCWNPVLFQQPDGALQLYYKCGPSPSTWWGMLTESTDYGATWSWSRRLPDTIDGPVKNKPVMLANGELLCGSSTEYDGWTVHFEITSDAGRTWERIGPINSGEQFNAIQPTILTHADGRLQILCRSKENRITTSWSEDDGRTWSEMEATSLPNPNAGTDAVTLEDGRHLLVYNHTLRGAGSPRGRSLLNVAVSEDGELWSAALVLENSEGEYSYPAVIQTDDGLVHITYTWRRQRVRHVVVDPDALELHPIEDGIWPGLPEAGREE